MRSLSIVMFVAVACAHQSEISRSDLPAADLAVYRAVLDSMFVREASGAVSQLVLRDSTTVLRGNDPVKGLIGEFSRLPGADTAAIRNLATRSRAPHSLKELSRLGLRIPVVLADRQMLAPLPRQDLDEYWRQFYRKYPGASGLISLSAIGYSANGDVAILMVDQGCGSLCGNGYNVSLRRVAGAWRIAAIHPTWIS